MIDPREFRSLSVLESGTGHGLRVPGSAYQTLPGTCIEHLELMYGRHCMYPTKSRDYKCEAYFVSRDNFIFLFLLPPSSTVIDR